MKEHFCTLFSSHFLLMGLSLYQSLCKHAPFFHLWIICMNEEVEKQLTILNLPNVSLIPLSRLETNSLLSVKSQRTFREYCWTLSSFTFTAVFREDLTIKRVTYLDADLFFFDDPQVLLQELEDKKRSILITEHAFASNEQYWIEKSGRFCVQFLTVDNSEPALEVINWWQERCLEWCFDRYEPGRHGDQKYLDLWTELFPEQVHILQQKEKALAPWNVNRFLPKSGEELKPVFYHFQGFRTLSPYYAVLYSDYQLNSRALKLYQQYLKVIRSNVRLMRKHRFEIFSFPFPYLNVSWTRILKYQLQGTLKLALI